MFTLRAAARYASVMLLLAAAALLASSTSQTPSRVTVLPEVQAQASVRIIAGSTIQLGQASTADGQQLRSTTIATADGTQPATLVEFQ